ncbi:DUF4190 domain-containing protein [Cellulomonas sp. P22]|uniref:DUF4190 domain-containing protein n=1 Tax=Cellulomonas sp. P22 TaxID=3373189 RepID=UPI0037BD03BE
MTDQTPAEPAQPAAPTLAPPLGPPTYAPVPVGTDPLAIAGLVCAFLVWPVGLGLSIAALVRTRRSGQGGRGLAIGGIVVASLGFVGTVLSVVMLVLVGGPLSDAIDDEMKALESSQPTATAAEPSPTAADDSAAAGEAVETPTADGTWTAPATAAGLTGQARACEILFSGDPESLMSVLTADDGTDPEGLIATVGQIFDAARADLDPALAADVTTLQTLFAPETYLLTEPELTAATEAGDAAGNRLAAACGVELG